MKKYNKNNKLGQLFFTNTIISTRKINRQKLKESQFILILMYKLLISIKWNN
jgi:hypothetical protein